MIIRLDSDVRSALASPRYPRFAVRDHLYVDRSSYPRAAQDHPPLNLGGVSLDIAFMAVFIGVYVLQRVIVQVFF